MTVNIENSSFVMSHRPMLPRLVHRGGEMRAILKYSLGALLALNGVAMLLAPEAWYHAVPGVTETGPFNPHFVRDIGAAYLAAGAGLAWFAARREARPAAILATVFLGVHALIHFADAMSGRETWSGLARDLPGVFLPPLLALWLVWRRHPQGDIR
jgi:uncharacterized protein YjeT (DUF2065 family)